MINAFCDESENEKPRIFTLAGWLATPTAWDELDRRWRKMLKSTGPAPVSAFHMAHIAAGQGEFADWTQQQRDALVRAATDLLLYDKVIALLYGVAATIVIDDFNKRLPGWRPASDDLYIVCYERLFLNVLERPQVQNGICLTFDKRRGVEHRVAERFDAARRMIDQVRPGMFQLCSFEDDTDSPALQAADFLCYEVRRAAYQRIISPDRPERMSLTRLRTRQHCFSWYDYRFIAQLEKAYADTGRPIEQLWFTVRPPEDRNPPA